jgi:LysM repeat protein
VQERETLSDIASLYDVTVDDILALNPNVDPELIKPGQVLRIPAATPMPGSISADEAGGLESTSDGFVVHIVTSGETLSSIAKEYDVSVSAIRVANDLSPDDETIRAEQSLVVPLNTPTPTPTPTADPDVSPTSVPLYASPPLLYPPDGATLTDETPVLLQWASVDILESDEWYELYLWQPGGGVVSSTIHTRATAWRVPLDLMEKADGDAPRFRWRVQVVREAAEQIYEEAGASSPAHSFVWQRQAPSQPSPTPSAP